MILDGTTRSWVKRVVEGFCISVAACSTAFVPVMVFTFGLSNSPYIQETNPLFAGYFTTHGLVAGLLLALLTNLIPAAAILAVLHLLFYRPVIFYEPRSVGLGRMLIAVGGGLFLLTWAQKFFYDGYNDMTILNMAGIGSSSILWAVFLGCLCLFTAGSVYWGMRMTSGFRVTRIGEKRKMDDSEIAL